MVIIVQSVTFCLYARVQGELKQSQKVNIPNTNDGNVHKGKNVSIVVLAVAL